jgi:signal transduction histidine kinase
MTLRLVALMSVVLLLSLVAVGLLVNHYQERFMQEVQSTAADVGQAALRTLEWTGSARAHRTAAAAGDGPAPTDAARSDGVRDVVVTVEGDAREHVERIKHVITTSTHDNEFTVQEQVVYPVGAFSAELLGADLEDEFKNCLVDRLQAKTVEDHHVMINVEAVRAETDPMGGLVLKIPTAGKLEAEQGKVRYEFQPFPPGADGPAEFFARRDEIQLPIRGNFQELFGKMRNRSLFLFMGVFLVGMVLSTGLASRFTRPVRKLDAGIRRLSAGDLDVEVAVHGKGEIGRLGRAFNEMAGKLRANRERERELTRREKLSALGRLAAGVAHDVRNPLHSIGLTLQHLSETARPESPERVEEFDHSVGVIRGEIRRLDQLVGNFLSFAKSERRERRPLDLGELLRDTVRLVEKESERRRVRLELDTDGALPLVLADAESIRSSLLNLILNSFEAMPQGGTLSVTLSAQDGEVLLEVADTGEGISEEEQEHVFDFAYTTRESGNGLGLAMVHHCVVEEHAGRVTLASRPGEGTRVSLIFPAEGAETS